MTRIIDITTPGDPEDVPAHLMHLSTRCAALASQIRERLTRNDRTMALVNFSLYTAGELRQLSGFYPRNVPALAWVTRNLFESNLTVRYVLLSDENFRSWLGQTLEDEKDFIDGVILVSSEQRNESNYASLQMRRNELEKIAERHGFGPCKPFRVPVMAKKVGMHEEYVGLYKLFSKYVHPSSLLVNAWYDQKPGLGWLDVFIVKAQIYAGDTIQRIADACELKT